MQQVRVAILGREYVINTKEDRLQTEKVADFVNQYCEEISRNLNSPSSINTITLAALHIANDYFRVKEEYSKLVEKIERKAAELDRVLALKEGLQDYNPCDVRD